MAYWRAVRSAISLIDGPSSTLLLPLLHAHKASKASRSQLTRLISTQQCGAISNQSVHLIGFGVIVHPSDMTLLINQNKSSTMQQAAWSIFIFHCRGKITGLADFKNFLLITRHEMPSGSILHPQPFRIVLQQVYGVVAWIDGMAEHL